VTEVTDRDLKAATNRLTGITYLSQRRGLMPGGRKRGTSPR